MNTDMPLWPITLRTMVAIGILSLFSITVLCLLFIPMPLTEAAGTLLTALIGVLIAKLATIVDYFFGSSQSSKDKDVALERRAIIADEKLNGK